MRSEILSAIVMAMFVLSLTAVIAETPEKADAGIENKEALAKTPDTVGEGTDIQKTANTLAQKETAGKPELTGLENAMSRVKNNETKAHLEKVFAKIQDKRKEQLAKLENLEITKDEKNNKTIVTGKGKAKFLGFMPVNKNYEYEVDDDGNVKKHGKAFDFLFKKQDPIDEAQ